MSSSFKERRTLGEFTSLNLYVRTGFFGLILKKQAKMFTASGTVPETATGLQS